MKTCTKCKESKELSEFFGNEVKRRADCKVCNVASRRDYKKQWKRDNKDRLNKKRKDDRAANKHGIKDRELAYRSRPEVKEAVSKRNASYYTADKQGILDRNKNYFDANPAVRTNISAKYRAAKLNATPPWADLEAIKAVYQECADLQWLSEEPLEVDHVIPLQGKNVKGLHIASNLQILTRSENRKKNNKIKE